MAEAVAHADIVALVEAVDLEIDQGLDLLDADDVFQLDISDDLSDGTIEHGNYRTIHGTCVLAVSRELPWGSARVRPWMSLTSPSLDLTKTWSLGVYLLTTPEDEIGDTPRTWRCEGYDKLKVLDSPTGRSVSLVEGEALLDFAAAIIVEAGEPATSIRFDPSSSTKVANSTKTWPLDQDTTWLMVVNDVMATLGYRGVYMDRDGRFCSEPYVAPRDRAPDWIYDADSETTILGEDRTRTADYFDAPNRWVFVLDDPTQGLPTEGAGIYTVLNQSDGPTSIDARGRIISTVVRLDAVDQESLERQGDARVDDDKRVASVIDMTSGPNPDLWHFAVIEYRDAAIGAPLKMVDQSWQLPLNGSDMRRTVKEVG